MAPITPYTEGYIGRFDTKSKEFSDIRPDKSIGIALSGLGDAIGIGLEGWDKLNKFNLEQKIVKDVTDEKVESNRVGLGLILGANQTVNPAIPPISPTGSRTSSGDSTGVLTPGMGGTTSTSPSAPATSSGALPYTAEEGPYQQAYPPQPPAPVTGFPAPLETASTAPAGVPVTPPVGPLPQGVLQGLAEVDRRAQAAKLGKYHDIALGGALHEISARLSAQHPTLAPFIQQHVRQAAGFDPLNMQRAAINQTLQTLAAAQKSDDKEWVAEVDRMRPQIPPQVIQQAYEAKDPETRNRFRVYFGEIQHREHLSDRAQKEHQAMLTAGQLSEQTATINFHKVISPKVQELYVNLNFRLGGEDVKWESILKTIDDYQTRFGGVLPPDVKQDVANAVGLMERHINVMGARLAANPSFSPYIKNENVAKIMERYTTELNLIKQQVGTDNVYMASNTLNTAKGLQERVLWEAMKNPVYRDFFLISSLGHAAPTVMEHYIKTDENRTKLNEAVNSLVHLQRMNLFTPNNPNIPSNMYDYFKTYQSGTPADYSNTPEGRREQAAYLRTTLDFPRAVLASPEAGDNEKFLAAVHISNPQNAKFIQEFTKDEKPLVWSALYSPDTIKRMQDVATRDRGTNIQPWVQYTKMGTQIFREIMNEQLGTLRESIEQSKAAPNMRLNWNTGQIELFVPSQEQRESVIRSARRSQDIATSRRLNLLSTPVSTDAEQAMTSMNTALKTYKNLIEAQGLVLDSAHLKDYFGINIEETIPTVGGKQTEQVTTTPTTPVTAFSEEGSIIQPRGITTTSFTRPVEGEDITATRSRNPIPAEGQRTGLPSSEDTGQGTRNVVTGQQAITQAIEGSGRYRGPANTQVQEAINTVVQGTGRSPAFIAAMASIESDMGRKVGGAKYRGLFQQGGSNVHSGEDPDDPGTNAKITVRTMLANEKVLTKALGRKPEDYEAYLGHQQGANGAQALLKGAEEGLTAVESLKKYAGLSTVEAMANLRQNRLPDIRDTPLQNLSAAAFTESWRNAVETRKRAFGGTGKRSDIPFAEEDVSSGEGMGPSTPGGGGSEDFFEDGRPTLSSIETPNERLERNRRNLIRDGSILPTKDDSAEIWAEYYKGEEDRRESEKPGSSSGKRGEVRSDVSDPLLVGEQYAANIPPGQRLRPDRPLAEGGGGVAPTQSYSAYPTKDANIVGYRIIDKQTGQQVGKDYTISSPERTQTVRRRVDNKIDKMDNEYGAYRYRREYILEGKKGIEPRSKGEPGGYQARETVENAAIQLKDGTIKTGPNHAEIVIDLPSKALSGAKDGFITSSGRFVSQEEARQLIKKTNPQIDRAIGKRKYLISEDINDSRLKMFYPNKK